MPSGSCQRIVEMPGGRQLMRSSAREALAFRSKVRRQLEMQLLQILDQVRLMPKDDESDPGFNFIKFL